MGSQEDHFDRENRERMAMIYSWVELFSGKTGELGGREVGWWIREIGE